MKSTEPPDEIVISDLSIHLPNGLGPSAFGIVPPPPCPILLTARISLNPQVIPSSARSDSMEGLQLNYSTLSRRIYAIISDRLRVWTDPVELLEVAAAVPLALRDAVTSVKMSVELPRALLHASSVVYEATFTSGAAAELVIIRGETSCQIRNLMFPCTIGLHSHEREEDQRIELDLRVGSFPPKSWSHKKLADEVYDYIADNAFETLERLAHDTTRHILSLPMLMPEKDAKEPTLHFTARKPSALPYATPSICVTKTLASYTDGRSPSFASHNERIFIALGSNMGDRVDNICRAMRLLEQSGVKIIRTSWLYESKPMYVTDQDLFLNCAIEVSSSLTPLALLRLLKRTERAVGRTPTFPNGPRVIDLDLVFHGDSTASHGEPGDKPDEDGVGWLRVPHPRVHEREFVLRPLADIASNFRHPTFRRSIQQLLDHLLEESKSTIQAVIPIAGARLLYPCDRAGPLVMAIFNATPDSFSDGDASRLNIASAIETILKMVDTPHPPAILDIGGMSTRPDSEPCSEEEELQRVVPLIKAIRAHEHSLLASIPISIDTYRPAVARASVEAGANIINDVRAGSEPGMLALMAELGVPVVLMHSRGDSKTMSSLTDYPKGVLNGVRTELAARQREALAAGVKRWNIIIDPGLGFAKSHEDNIKLLSNLSELRTGDLHGAFLLVGASRKGFVGKTIERETPSERDWGDAVWVAHCVRQWVNIVRVHDPRGATEAIKMEVAICDAEL